MAQDRLWQMEMWRRAAEGRMAEVAGPGAVARDRTARLLRYRGPFDDAEWTSYHPDGKRIFTAFANGVNAFIAQHKDRLPIEFVVSGLTPEPWTVEQLVLRPRPSATRSPSCSSRAAWRVRRAGGEPPRQSRSSRRSHDPDRPRSRRGLRGRVASVRAALRQFRRCSAHRPLPAAGGDDTSVREPGSNNWSSAPHAPRPAIPSSPTIRTASDEPVAPLHRPPSGAGLERRGRRRAAVRRRCARTQRAHRLGPDDRRHRPGRRLRRAGQSGRRDPGPVSRRVAADSARDRDDQGEGTAGTPSSS